MIKAILVDDEVHCLDTLNILIEELCPQVQVVDKCTSAEAALAAIRRLSPTLVFLDIEMPYMNGFQMLEQLPDINFSLIFTTSYDQYAIKAIRFSALDYLLKPIEPNELVAAVKKVEFKNSLPLKEQFQLLFHKVSHRGGEFTKIAVPTLGGYELFPIDQLLSCEANDNYTKIYLKDKRKIVACRSMKEMEGQLQEFPSFIRVHNSFLVNLNEVTKYVRGEGGYVVMSDGSTINVSRGRKDALLKSFSIHGLS